MMNNGRCPSCMEWGLNLFILNTNACMDAPVPATHEDHAQPT